jgi:hypothetical protein
MRKTIWVVVLLVGVGCESREVKEARELNRKKTSLWGDISPLVTARDKTAPDCAYAVVATAVKALPKRLDKSFNKRPENRDLLRGAVPFEVTKPNELEQWRKMMWHQARLVEPNELLKGVDGVDYDSPSCRPLSARARRAYDSVGQSKVKETPFEDYELARDELAKPIDEKPPARIVLAWRDCGGTGGADYSAKGSGSTVHISRGQSCAAGLAWIDLATGKLLAAATGEASESSGVGDSTTERAASGANMAAYKAALEKAGAGAREAMTHW